MKKNTMMRLASALLVLVLLTTCAISGTFAKYTSAAGGEDIARVAYWGWGSNAFEINDLFETAYIADEVLSAGAMDTTVTDIIAPGTTHSATFAFAYTNYQNTKITAPEVAYTLVVDTTGSSIPADIENNKNIRWALDAENDDDYGTWDEMIAAIEALDGDKTYAPGQMPAAFGPDSEHTISWKWVFTGTEEYEVAGQTGTGTDGKLTQDEYDTYMGNKQLLDQVNLVINITATQVDEFAVPTNP